MCTICRRDSSVFISLSFIISNSSFRASHWSLIARSSRSKGAPEGVSEGRVCVRRCVLGVRHRMRVLGVCQRGVSGCVLGVRHRMRVLEVCQRGVSGCVLGLRHRVCVLEVCIRGGCQKVCRVCRCVCQSGCQEVGQKVCQGGVIGCAEWLCQWVLCEIVSENAIG